MNVEEFKELVPSIIALHNEGIRVDVIVYCNMNRDGVKVDVLYDTL